MRNWLMMASGEDYEDFCVVGAPSSPTARAVGDTEDRIRSLDSRVNSRVIPSRGQSRGYSTWGPNLVSSLHIIVCESAAMSTHQCLLFSYVDSRQFATHQSNGGEVRSCHTASIELKRSSSTVKSISEAETHPTSIMSFKNMTRAVAPGESCRRAPWSVPLWPS